MCSRLRSGSASIESSARSPETVPLIFSQTRILVVHHRRRRRGERARGSRSTAPRCFPACRSRGRRRRGASGCARGPRPTPRGPWSRLPAVSLARRRPSSDPRSEIRRRKLRKREKQIAEIALGSTAMVGMPSIAASSISADAQAGLPAPGHAPTMTPWRGEVFRVVKDQLRLSGAPGPARFPR